MRARLVPILAALTMPGCSSTQRISDAATAASKSASAIVADADDSLAHVDSIKDEVAASRPDLSQVESDADAIAGNQKSIKGNAGHISDAAASIHDEIPNVKNRGGFFEMLGTIWHVFLWVLLGLLVVGFVVLLDRLGLTPLWRKLMEIFPWLISQATKKKAQLAAKAIDPAASGVDATHLVASMRADPVFNAAYEAEQVKREQEKGQTLVDAAKASAVTAAPVEVPSTAAPSPAIDVVEVEPTGEQTNTATVKADVPKPKRRRTPPRRRKRNRNRSHAR